MSWSNLALGAVGGIAGTLTYEGAKRLWGIKGAYILTACWVAATLAIALYGALS